MQIKTETDNLDVGVFRIFGQFQVHIVLTQNGVDTSQEQGSAL